MGKKDSKNQLKRGLSAYFSREENIEDTAGQSDTVSLIPLGQIEVNPFQPRKSFDQEALEDLAESIKVHGLIQPVTLRNMGDGKFQLIAGERRYKAAQLAGLDELPAYIREASDQDMMEMALVENLQREDLNPIEIATTYQRLKNEFNFTDAKLAQRVKKSRSAVTNFLRLLKLAPMIQTALKENVISMGHGRTLAGVEDIDMQLEIFEKVVEEELSVRATENLVQKYQKPSHPEPKKAPQTENPFLANVRDNLRKYLGTKVIIKQKKSGQGTITIPFSSDQDLNRLLDLIEEDQ